MNEHMYLEFEREAAFMVNIKPHENVVRTYGVVLDEGNAHGYK